MSITSRSASSGSAKESCANASELDAPEDAPEGAAGAGASSPSKKDSSIDAASATTPLSASPDMAPARLALPVLGRAEGGVDEGGGASLTR